MDKLLTHYDESSFLFLNDLLLTPIFLIIVLYLANVYVKSKKNPVYAKYFMVALSIRFASAIVLALIYQYYYHGGDTLTYFIYVQRLRDIYHLDSNAFYEIIFNYKDNQFPAISFLGEGVAFYLNESSNFIIRLALALSYPLLNTYMLISFVFTIFCFYGCWKIFLLFTEIYPHLEKEFALSCLFLPSVCFWGTGILKDPICLGALGGLTFHIYKLVFERTQIFKRIFLIIIFFWMLKIIKVYIILSFMPAYTFWIFFKYKDTIKSSILKSLMSPILFIIATTVGAYVFIKIGQYSERYAFDNLVRTAKDTQNWLYISTETRGGSGYTFGNIDYTPLGILKVFPKAVNVALFRPYIWEARKPILVPAALEGLFSLFFTIRLLYKAGFVRFTRLIIVNPEVQFCLVFSIIFAFSVGFTSYNFGSLVRYKIPLMPFYYIALFIIADKEKVDEKIKKTAPVKTRPKTTVLVPSA